MGVESRRWLVSGTSSGIGWELANLVAGNGDTLIGTVRNETDRDRLAALGQHVRPVVIDLTEPPDRVADEVRRAIEWAGGLDIVVNNAGYGLVGAIEEVSEVEARHQIETNFWGPWKLIRAALPALRKSSGARIVNVSSIAGFQGAPAMGMYDASKFALEGLSEALRLELAPLGIRVSLVEPGAFRTKWAGAGLVLSTVRMPEYEAATEPIRTRLPTLDGHQPGDPERAAAAIVRLTEMSSPPLRLPLGRDAVDALRTKVASIIADIGNQLELSTSTEFVAEKSAPVPEVETGDTHE